ncbi:MAG: hypothetical protein N3G20_03735 [Verrucomicrobiae bacterium]|nr:hypothetical protein [Verrucomicrobiae bacterium]
MVDIAVCGAGRVTVVFKLESGAVEAFFVIAAWAGLAIELVVVLCSCTLGAMCSIPQIGPW